MQNFKTNTIRRHCLLTGTAITLMAFAWGCSHSNEEPREDEELRREAQTQPPKTKEAAVLTESEADSVVVTGTRLQRESSSFSIRPIAQSFPAPPPVNQEQYDNGETNPVKLVRKEPVSTFSADVDTASYGVMRRYLQGSNQLPPPQSVRVEEMLNYFTYNYQITDQRDTPFQPTTWVTPTPWNEDTKLMHIGIKGYDLKPEQTPDSNIVLLIDVSGSMQSAEKLPLVKKSIELMVNEMDEDDTISMVVYAGAAGIVLEPTPGSQKSKILGALNDLKAGGSTAGGAGISLAYKLAEENYAEDKVNRIILASDGDFNVGTVDNESLEGFVAQKRETGIYLTIIGFGGGNYNDVLAQKLAQAGNGIAAYIDNLNEARKVLVNEISSSLFPIANDVKFQVEFNPALVAEYRLIGYETRILNEEDFNNDAVDAGDIGSGHTVTALYEIAMVGSKGRLIDDRRYDNSNPVTNNQNSDELAFLKIRYKQPGDEESQLISHPLKTKDIYSSLENAPRDARFAASVAAFGQKLAQAPYVSGLSYKQIRKIAQSNKGQDPYGYRSEFVQLVRAVEKASSSLIQ